MGLVNIIDKEHWRRGLIAAGFKAWYFNAAFVISTFVEYRKDSPLYGIAVVPREKLCKLVGVDEEYAREIVDVLVTFNWLKLRKVQLDGNKYVVGLELQHGSNLEPLETVNEEQFKYDYKNVVSWDFVGAND